VKEFRQESELAGNLVLMNGAAITSRHYIDASGGVIVGKFTTIGGVRSTILSHGIDFASNKQGCAPVIVGNYSFISTNCVLVKGAVLPSSSVLGANSLLTAKFNANSSPGLYGGSPAKHLREYAGEYFSRSEAYVKVEKKTAI
jgi:acetyltransferase-like isoleucine patch superfamily enzyme